MSLKTYDPTAVKVIVNAIPMSGFADGDMVSVEFNEDAWTFHRGTDGDTSRIYMAQEGGMVTIRLASTSPMNAVLNGFAKLDKFTKMLPVSIMVIDTLGGTKILAMQAWLRKDPGVSFGREVQEKEWVYDTDLLEIDHQGGF